MQPGAWAASLDELVAQGVLTGYTLLTVRDLRPGWAAAMRGAAKHAARSAARPSPPPAPRLPPESPGLRPLRARNRALRTKHCSKRTGVLKGPNTRSAGKQKLPYAAPGLCATSNACPLCACACRTLACGPRSPPSQRRSTPQRCLPPPTSLAVCGLWRTRLLHASCSQGAASALRFQCPCWLPPGQERTASTCNQLPAPWGCPLSVSHLDCSPPLCNLPPLPGLPPTTLAGDKLVVVQQTAGGYCAVSRRRALGVAARHLPCGVLLASFAWPTPAQRAAAELDRAAAALMAG
jgi:hypothetical protein